MARQLLEAILDNGVANPHYFDGRLLTATALRDDQAAHRARQRHLGRALGAGVVQGLFIGIEFPGSGSAAPLVSVQAGLAINGNGQTLELPAREIVALARTSTPPPAAADLFRTCEPPTAQVEGPGDGFYVLVVAPASGFRGRAPASGLSDPTAGAGCGSQWAVEGVRFRLVQLDPLAVTGLSSSTRQLLETELLGATTESGLSRLRNVIAHLCLGTEPLAGFATDPFARETEPDGSTEAALADYGALDGLLDNGALTDCDVPLALIHWRLNGLVFVDNWAVRRRLAPPATAITWPTLSGGRRRAEAEAVLFQFQEQMAAVVAQSANPSAIRASDYFRWVAPAGFLPLAGVERGVDVAFFDPLPHRDPIEYLNGERIGDLIQRSLFYEPIDLAEPEMVWLYYPWQQDPARAAGTTVRSYLLFASGHLPPYATARFDVARWDFSNYAECCGDAGKTAGETIVSFA
jgi:hypothetical protein